MKVTCPISGVTYELAGVPTADIIHTHPILSPRLDIQSLKDYLYSPYLKDQLDQTHIHLLGVALMLKLPLESTITLPSNAAAMMEDFWHKVLPKLFNLASKLESRSVKNLPKLRVTMETLPYLPHWIDELSDAINYHFMPISEEAKRRNREAYKSEFLDSILGDAPVNTYSDFEIDSLILRGLRGSLMTEKESRVFPSLLADWADKETTFPNTAVTLKNGKRSTINAVWSSLIIQVFKPDGMINLVSSEFTSKDIDSLLEWLAKTPDIGYTLQCSAIIRKLEEAKEVLDEFKMPMQVTVVSDSKEPTAFHTSNPDNSGLTLKQKLALKMAAIKAGK